MTFVDIWNYTIPTQEKYPISRPVVYENIAAFYVYKGKRQLTVEIQPCGFRSYVLFVTGQEPVFTDSLHIRKDMFKAVDNAFKKMR